MMTTFNYLMYFVLLIQPVKYGCKPADILLDTTAAQMKHSVVEAYYWDSIDDYIVISGNMKDYSSRLERRYFCTKDNKGELIPVATSYLLGSYGINSVSSYALDYQDGYFILTVAEPVYRWISGPFEGQGHEQVWVIRHHITPVMKTIFVDTRQGPYDEMLGIRRYVDWLNPKVAADIFSLERKITLREYVINQIDRLIKKPVDYPQ